MGSKIILLVAIFVICDDNFRQDSDGVQKTTHQISEDFTF